MITTTDIAEIYDGLGLSEKAAVLHELAEDERRGAEEAAEELSDAVWAVEQLLNKVLEPSRAKHDEACWTKHAACLVDRIRGLLPA